MLHKVIKRAREERSLTQSMVASLADVPRSQIQILEKGGNVTRETLEKVLSAMGMSLAVVSRDDVARMRDALRELDLVIGKLTAQVTAPPFPDPHRLLQMSRELVEFVRATAGDAAAAHVAAAADAQASQVDEQVAHVEEAEREARQSARTAGRRRR